MQVAFEVDIDALAMQPHFSRPRHQRHHSLDDLLDGPRDRSPRHNSAEPRVVVRRNPDQVVNRRKKFAEGIPNWHSSPGELSPEHQPQRNWEQTNHPPVGGSPYRYAGIPGKQGSPLRQTRSTDMLGRPDSELWGEPTEGKMAPLHGFNMATPVVHCSPPLPGSRHDSAHVALGHNGYMFSSMARAGLHWCFLKLVLSLAF